MSKRRRYAGQDTLECWQEGNRRLAQLTRYPLGACMPFAPTCSDMTVVSVRRYGQHAE